MSAREAWEYASFVITALGLPVAIVFFAWDQLKERDTTVQTERMLVIFDMLISQFAAGKLMLEHYHHDGLGVFARATSP